MKRLCFFNHPAIVAMFVDRQRFSGSIKSFKAIDILPVITVHISAWDNPGQVKNDLILRDGRCDKVYRKLVFFYFGEVYSIAVNVLASNIKKQQATKAG
jgi:hypothetical protein